MARTAKQKLKIPKEEDDFKWAPLIIPWLPPQSLASLASTCSSLRSLSKTITYRRIADAAQGFEKFPVPIFNAVDTILYPYFLYIPTSVLSISSPKQQWGHPFPPTPSKTKPLVSSTDEILEGSGCKCTNCYQDDPNCACNKLSVYTENGRISLSDGGRSPNPDGGCNPNPSFESFECESKDEGPMLVMECGPACRCERSCRNRVSQRGLSVRVDVLRHLNKGWGLHLAEPLKRGTFVCEYAGEFLTTAEARKKLQHYDTISKKHDFCPALLVIREHLPSGQACLRLNIDATIIGNIARFINHSCDGGNLFPTLVRSSGSVLPRLCFFASKDIPAGEELTFSYGIVGKSSKTLPCFCNSAACCGMLPSEPT